MLASTILGASAPSVSISATASTNRAPVAKAGPNQSVRVSQVVAFDGSASFDPDGDPLTYLWNFGDGTPPVSGATATHVYAQPGLYTVTLTVGDRTISASASSSVTVNDTPGTADTFDDSFDSPTLGNGWTEVRGQASIQGKQLWSPAAVGDYLAIVPTLYGSDQQASADFASPDNNRAPRFGIVLRFQDPRNYYLVYRQTGGSSLLRISRVVEGVETVLKQKNIPNPFRGVWFRLGARVEGQVLTLLLNELPLLTVSDGTLADGTLGLLLASKGPLSLPADEFRAAVE